MPDFNSAEYWSSRYRSGGNSGTGSYGRLATFKSEILNNFVKKHALDTVIEFGCGDWNQLSLAQYPHYLGFDVAPESIELCNSTFSHKPIYQFKHMREYQGQTAQLALSLDVVYHLTEDEVFHDYMSALLDSSQQFVIIYSSNLEMPRNMHVKHRRFMRWIDENRPGFELVKQINNPYPGDNHLEYESFSDFYIFEKTENN